MVRRALELQAPHWADFDEELLVPDVAERLGEVRVPTLVVVGEEDVEDMHTIATRLAAAIPDARLETIPGAAHFPSLERPDVFDPLVVGFLNR
jgi:pimeloyl-ACP methyl ester carboxylesterase